MSFLLFTAGIILAIHQVNVYLESQDKGVRMKKGFTLVELMVVITIIGILAGIAIPQFGNALARARAAEAPGNLNKIRTAQEAYFIEVKAFKDGCTWLQSTSTSPAHNLGVKMSPSKFFTYSSSLRQYTDANGDIKEGFTASATLVKNIGNAEAGSSSKVSINESDDRYVEGSEPTKEALTVYLRTFLSDQ